MEWLILLVLVPAILGSIVLLFGFAGCEYHERPAQTSPPTMLLLPESVDRINVRWFNTDPRPVIHYRFVRKKGSATEFDDLTLGVGQAGGQVIDTGLDEGTDYTYEVSTTTAEGGESSPGTAVARTFKIAFAVDPATTPPIDRTVSPDDNYCYVQRIPASLLRAGGSRIKFILWGSPDANATISRIWVSRAAGSGNLWDSDTDLTQVSSLPFNLPDATPRELYPATYSLDQTQDLIIAFDLIRSAGAANVRFVSVPGVALFCKRGVHQASQPARDPDFTTQPDPRLHFVLTIGVE